MKRFCFPRHISVCAVVVPVRFAWRNWFLSRFFHLTFLRARRMARAGAKMCFPFAIMDAIMMFMHSILSLLPANNEHFFGLLLVAAIMLTIRIKIPFASMSTKTTVTSKQRRFFSNKNIKFNWVSFLRRRICSPHRRSIMCFHESTALNCWLRFFSREFFEFENGIFHSGNIHSNFNDTRALARL